MNPLLDAKEHLIPILTTFLGDLIDSPMLCTNIIGIWLSRGMGNKSWTCKIELFEELF